MNIDTKQKKIENVFEKYKYIMTTAQLKEEGFYHADIVRLLNSGVIEKVKRGYYYYLENDNGSEILIINKLFPDAVLCMETALFYYGYTDRNPSEWNFVIDKMVSKGRTKIDYPFITTYRVESSVLVLGETKGVIDGEPVRIYDKDRTICEEESKRFNRSMAIMADIATSVLAKLRNKAKSAGISYQQCLQLFVQEEFLRKLSKSGYDDHLVLKDGLFIYTLTNFEGRTTVNVDFLLRHFSNSMEDVQALI